MACRMVMGLIVAASAAFAHAGLPGTYAVDGVATAREGRTVTPGGGYRVVGGAIDPKAGLHLVGAWFQVIPDEAGSWDRDDGCACLCLDHIFSDDFESGDTSAWSATVPSRPSRKGGER